MEAKWHDKNVSDNWHAPSTDSVCVFRVLLCRIVEY